MSSITSPIIDQIYKHGSVRDYSAEPVSKETVEAIVAAAQRSASSSNLQVYSVVAVVDAERRSQISEIAGNQAHIIQAPVFLTWCADLSRLERVCQRRGYTQRAELMEPFLIAAVDVAIAMQTATLAAESLGLGTCYIGAIRNDPARLIELLNLPRLVFPISGMTLGWPAAQPKLRPRLPLDAVLHWEAYDCSQEERLLEEYDRAMVETGIYDGRQVPVPGVEGEMEDYGWQEHSARRVSRLLRPHLRDVLTEQGLELR
ncbi:MAG: NADPH-dependent oxidoreductase [Caldilineaceae bacterium]|jgi:FMN reductase (NADPH)